MLAIHKECVEFYDDFKPFSLLDRSVIAATKELLTKGYQYVLTEKIACQDNLEHLFAHQRYSGGTNSNPTVGEFQRNILVREACKSVALPSKRGNCRGGVQAQKITVDNTPLRKRKSNKITADNTPLKKRKSGT